MKKILYVDMDNVLVNFQSGIDRLSEEVRFEFEGRFDEVPGIFGLMDPIDGAIEAYEKLSLKYDTYILSTSPWGNDTAASDKVRCLTYFIETVLSTSCPNHTTAKPLYNPTPIAFHSCDQIF